MIGYFLDQKSVALYAFALGLLTMISKANPSLLLRGMFSSILTKQYSINKSMTNLKDKFAIITKITMIAVIPLYALLGINAKNIISLVYSDKYLETLPLIYIGLIFFIFREFTHPFNPLINTLEKNKLFLYTGIFSVYNGMANYILIPKLGIMGALIATGSASAMIFLFYLYQFKKIFISSYFHWKTLGKVILYSSSIILMGIIFNGYVTNVFLLFGVMLIEIIVFYFILTIFKVFSDEEREFLNKQIGKKLIRF